MRIRSVGHACLEIECAGLRVVTDPWWAGPAYTNQWYPWPTPQPAGLTQRAVDYIYLSHGHEDHLHVDTLKTLPRSATVLVPEFLSGSMVGFIRDELGFSEVLELRHGETITLRNGVKATCYINLTDSMLVLDDGEHVLLNANDALHSSPPQVIDYFCRLLRREHPNIDTLFLGFSGASWFPNCLRLPGKEDRDIACEREVLFTNNFIHIVEQLEPKVACAFAASFVLLEPHNRWINDVKFEVPAPDVAWADAHPNSPIKVHLLLPNDVVAGTSIVNGTTPRPSKATLQQAMRSVLKEGCTRAEKPDQITPEQLVALVGKLESRLAENVSRIPGNAVFCAELRLRGGGEEVTFRIDVDQKHARVALGSALAPTFTLHLRPEILEAALGNDYGIESIVIGYGAVAELSSPQGLQHVQTLLTLLSPRVNSWRGLLGEIQRDPMRSLGALRRQFWPLAFSLGTRLGILSHLYEPHRLKAA